MGSYVRLVMRIVGKMRALRYGVLVLSLSVAFVSCGGDSDLEIRAGGSLIGADLSDQDLSGRDLAGANLTEADLSGADLSNTDLRGARLIKANLSNTDLSNADLRGANLTGVVVGGTNFSGANLTGATFNQEAIGSQQGAPTTTTSTTTTTTTTIPPPAVPTRHLVNIVIDELYREEYFGGDEIWYTCIKEFFYSDGGYDFETYKQKNNPC